jgi:hypothetical protein
MPINLLSAGGGTTTLTTASSGSNFTVTLPAGTGTVITTAPGTSGNVLSSNGTSWVSSAPPSPAALSTASGAAPSYSARAWVNFNGTTSPGTIRASGNMSSVTKNTTGDYTVNFTTAMADDQYAWAGTARKEGNVSILFTGQRNTDSYTSSGFRFICQNDVAQILDSSIVSVIVFR